MDARQRGITIRGNSAQIAFTYQGVRCRETIPIPPTKTAQKELALKRQAILYEISIGTFDYSKHFPYSKKAKEFRKNRPDRYTIREGLIDWLQRAQSRCQPSTLRDYESAIYHHLVPTFGDLTIEELTALKIKEWRAELPCSNKRKNNILIPLRQLYDEMYHDEIITKNPLDHVKNLPIHTREPKPFTPDEVASILNELVGQEKNLIQFAFWTGLRTSELIALRWQDVDMDKIASMSGLLKYVITSKAQKPNQENAQLHFNPRPEKLCSASKPILKN